MPSGYKVVQGPNQYLKLKFTWEETATNTANNTSSVKWTLNLDTTGSGTGIIGAGTKYWKVVIDDETYDGWANVNGHSASISSGTATVAHNADGSKTFSYSFSLNIRITWGGTYVGTMSSSGSGVLTNIPRQSSIKSITGNQLGGDITIELNRAVSSYTHKVDYSFEGSSYTQALSGIGTSGSFTLPLELASRVPNATSGKLTIRVGTYSGTTKIGSTVSKTITAYVPSSVVPSISSVSIKDSSTAISTKFDAYIQSKSKVSVSISASGASGSTITSYKTTMEGSSYYGKDITTRAIKESGAVTISCTVTDSRGRTATKETTINALRYGPPRIVSLTANRSNADGTANIVGTYAKIAFSSVMYSLDSKNDRSTTITYRPLSGGSSTTVYSNVINYDINDFKVISGIEASDSYLVTMQVRDYFGTTTRDVIIKSGFFAITWLTDGRKGVAIGKVAEREGIDLGVHPMVDGKPMLFFATEEEL